MRLIVGVSVLFSFTHIFAAMVTNTNDSGAGSLRAAMTNQSDGEAIFTVSGTINLLSPLPTVTQTYNIVATDQSVLINGFGGTLFSSNTGPLTLTNLVVSDPNITGNILNSGSSSVGGLTINSTGTLNSTISGGATLTIAEGSAITVASNSSGFSGPINVLGSLVCTTSSQLGTGNLITITGDFTVNNNIGTSTLTKSLSGIGHFNKVGDDTLELLRNSEDFSGLININAGTLVGGVSVNQFGYGPIANNAALVLAESGDGTLINNLSGNGTLTKTLEGNITLGGGNGSYSGTITISAGTLTGAPSSNAFGIGLITNNAAMVIDDPSLSTFGNVLTGAGTLTIIGPGETILTGANSGYSGAITITGGTLTGAPSTSSFGIGSIVNNGILTIKDNDSATFNNTLTGAGELSKAGTGNTTLSSSVSGFTGIISVSEGTLTGAPSTNSFGSGAIFNYAALVINDGSTATFSNTLMGSGTLTKTGTGNTTLSGTQSGATGTISVTAGTLTIDPSVTLGTSGISVASGGTLVMNGSVGATPTTTIALGGFLKGTGELYDVVVQGTIAPGLSIGTLAVAGDYTQVMGSTYQVELNSTGSSDLIDITGMATIESGTTLDILPEAGTYTSGTIYTILTAVGGVTGTYSTVISPARFSFLVSYTPTDVLLTLQQIEILGVTACDWVNVPLMSNLSTRIAAVQSSMVLENQNQRLTQSKKCWSKNGVQPYLIYDYARTNFKEKLSMPKGKDHLNNGQLGCDFYPSDWWMVGGAFTYTHADTKSQNGCGSVTANDYSGTFYTQIKATEYFFLDSMVLFGKSYYDTNRSGGFSGSTEGYECSTNLRLALQAPFGRRLFIEPIVGAYYSWHYLDSYKESGPAFSDAGESGSLAVGFDSFDLFECSEGVALWGTLHMGSISIVPRFIGSYVQQVLDRSYDVKMGFIGEDRIEYEFQNFDHTYWNLEADLAIYFTPCTSLSLNYQTEINDRYHNFGQGRALLKLAF